MIISNKKNIPQNISVKINGTPMDQCTQYKFLGIIIDKKTLASLPILNIFRCQHQCGALATLRYSMSTNLLKDVYHALIHSYMRYGILTWGNASQTSLKPLKVLINRAVRIMTFTPFGRIDLDPIYSFLMILDVEQVFYLETCKFMFKSKK